MALVAAAIDALREAGFAGASAREIAGRAGYSQALVFYHFGSVNDLLLAALDEVSARRMDDYRGLLEDATSVRRWPSRRGRSSAATSTPVTSGF